MGNCGSGNNMETINKLNEETLNKNAIEKEVKELERRMKAADAIYSSTMEKVEIMRSKNEVLANMIEIEEDRKKENERKLEALTYSLMQHGVTQKSMEEAKAGKNVEPKEGTGDDNNNYDDTHMDAMSLLRTYDVAAVLKKFSNELEAMRAARRASDEASSSVGDTANPSSNDKDHVEGTDASPTPKIRYSMAGWFFRDELDENGYPSVITLMSYNKFKTIILSRMKNSAITATDAEVLALRFSDENMVDIIEFIDYFETSLEERQRASAFNIMQLVPGKIKFPPYLLPTPPPPVNASMDHATSSSTWSPDLESTQKIDYHTCTKLELAANKMYMIFDSVVDKLQEELFWAAEKNVAGSTHVKTEEFQQILVDFCSIDKIDCKKLASTADITFGDFHKTPYITKRDAMLLCERFTFGRTGYVDYKVFLEYFKNARLLDMGLRGTTYDVRVSVVPPPSPARSTKRSKKKDKDAIAVPSDSAVPPRERNVVNTVEERVDKEEAIPISEEKSTVLPQPKSEKSLEAKAPPKSTEVVKSTTKKKKKKEKKESKGIIDSEITNDTNVINDGSSATNKTNPDVQEDDGKSNPPLTIVTSPTALKDSRSPPSPRMITKSPPSLLSPSIKSPVSASSVATPIDADELLENIRAAMEEQHEVDFVEATFKKFDKNSDGVLEKKEMMLIFEELNIPINPSEMQALFDIFDIDKNGAIDYNEFIDVLCEL